MARRRRPESGFALLLVFLMAAVIAISLYMEIPRVGFQTQRNKEQLLMERGEQYKLAIRRFMQANKRWPASLDELESLNNRRFLRRRYKDPMTGKDEWRLLHISNGVLTDSKNSKQGDKKEAATQNNFVADMPGLGSTPISGAASANPANRRRASDGGQPGGDTLGQGGPPMVGQPVIPGQPGMPGQTGFPGQPGFQGQQGIPGQPGQPGFNGMPPGVPGMPGATGVQPGVPIPQPGSYPGMPGPPVNSQNNGGFVGSGGSFLGGGQAVGSQPNNPTGAQPVYAGQQPPPYPTTPGSNGAQPPGFPNPGATTGGAQANPAIGMINSILTSPRPGGLAGVQQQNAMVGGSGIAGVASNLDADSIMTYADHTNYSEWEFVYDGKFTQPPDPRQGNGGTSVNQMANMQGSSMPGQPIGGSGRQGQQGGPQGQQPGGQGGMGIQQAGAPNGQSTNINLRPGRQ